MFKIDTSDFQNNILNILAALAVMSIFLDISKINKNIFMGFKTPDGRGDITKIKINNKNLNLIDESYNSNPLSLKSAILNFNKIKINIMIEKIESLYPNRVINPTNLSEIPNNIYLVYILFFNGNPVVLGHGKKNRAKVIFDNINQITTSHLKALFAL